MSTTKDAILKLKNGKTLYGILIEQKIQPETVVMIDYKNVELVGKRAIHDLLSFIPNSSIEEIDFCMK